jgi:hypothetical protein
MTLCADETWEGFKEILFRPKKLFRPGIVISSKNDKPTFIYLPIIDTILIFTGA